MSTGFSSSAKPLSPAVGDADLRRLEEFLGETISPLIHEARAAFRRDLPALLPKYPGRWVAYSGQQQLMIGSSKTSVYQDCVRRGLKPNQFLVLFIEPESRTG